jgi:hypothetical protein
MRYASTNLLVAVPDIVAYKQPNSDLLNSGVEIPEC